MTTSKVAAWPPWTCPAGDQGHERQDAALAVVIGAHDEHTVFERNRDNQGPDHKGEQAKRICWGRMAADRGHDCLVCV